MIENKNSERKNDMDTPIQLNTSLNRYITSLSGRNLSDHTAIAYRTDVRQFLTWLGENDATVLTPGHITRTHIIEYLAYLAGVGRSGVTRGRKLASIREYCKFLVLEGTLLHSPATNI